MKRLCLVKCRILSPTSSFSVRMSYSVLESRYNKISEIPFSKKPLMKKLLHLAILTFALTLSHTSALYAQAPAILMQRCYGGDSTDQFNCIKATADGGYIIGGQTLSVDGDLAGNGGIIGTWVLKMDGSGNIQWEKTIAGIPGYPGSVNYIEPTADGGYILTGTQQTIKLHSDGSTDWSLAQPGTTIHQVGDGGYILCNGNTNPDIIKYDASGNVAWQKNYNTGSSSDPYYTMIDACQVPSGGYLVTGGYMYDVGGTSGYLSKIDDSGNIIRPTETFASHAIGEHIVKGTDGSFALVAGKNNYYIIVRFDDTCAIEWNKEVQNMQFYDVTATSDGSYLACGSNEYSFSDALAINFDNAGNILWSKSMGGSSNDAGMSIAQSANGNFAMAGLTRSDDSEVSGNHGGMDAWLVIFGTNVAVPTVNNLTDLKVYPQPATSEITIELPQPYENANINIDDLLGRTMLFSPATAGSKRSVNIGPLSPGTYILHISSPAGTITRKVVKL